MTEVINIFLELQNTTKKSEKEAVIKANKDNELFLECLKFLLGDVTTGISKKKLSKKLNFAVRGIVGDWSGCMRYLAENNSGRDVDVALMQQFIQSQPEEHREIYGQLVTKSLKLGCDYKTVNKSLGYDLIKTWEVQQAYPMEKYPLKSEEWFSLSQKLNGNHCSWYKGKLISRQGKEFTGLQHIADDIMSVVSGAENLFLDGELIRKNVDGLSDADNFQKGTGIINSDAETKEEIEFIMYDIMPVDEYDAGCSVLKYKERRHILECLQRIINVRKCQHIDIVEFLYEGTDQSKIQELLDIADSKDWEGLMLNKDVVYQCKRHSGILKVKSFSHCDVKCIRVEEGDGRNAGVLGNIVVDYKGHEVGVGSGFTDEMRKEYFEHPERIVGKIVQVKYKTETKNKQGGVSLQFPVFEAVREDKTEPSYN